MAERRMFSRQIIDSDAFLDMSPSAQALYFHLAMRADDEGFVNNPKKIQRMVGAGDDDAKILCAKHFIIPFESGIVVIKHWRIHNYIRSDRMQETKYQDEKRRLSVKDNGIYTLCQASDGQVTDTCLTDDGQVTGKCQHRLGEVSIGEVSIGEERGEPAPAPTTLKARYGTFENVRLTDDELSRLKADYADWEQRVERLSGYIASKGDKYKSHYATIRNWARMDQETREAPARPAKVVGAQQYRQRDYSEEQLTDNGAVVDLIAEARKFMEGVT